MSKPTVQRLDATLIESMIREIKDACNKSDGHNEADTEAEEMAENLKCCGNCEHYHDGLINPCLRLEQNLWTNAGCYCDHWQYDGLTAKQRK